MIMSPLEATLMCYREIQSKCMTTHAANHDGNSLQSKLAKLLSLPDLHNELQV
ncbi:hypothetical protein JHK85_045632 [Glycine max]|uniref:Uncharacterized protein n=1 Tax=Glycine soja TaxID=3848 RepID=A0A0B2SLT7_GLYSO|nr:hypothetical protein JHK85_045632 [Glycine max]KHN47641.1 hypothetical protein glysoja_040387 [Glycine soja]